MIHDNRPTKHYQIYKIDFNASHIANFLSSSLIVYCFDYFNPYRLFYFLFFFFLISHLLGLDVEICVTSEQF